MGKDYDKKSVKRTLTINARRVKALLAELGWTQRDLADRTALELSHLNRVIHNERNAAHHIEKIANALGVAPKRILEEHAP